MWGSSFLPQGTQGLRKVRKVVSAMDRPTRSNALDTIGSQPTSSLFTNSSSARSGDFAVSAPQRRKGSKKNNRISTLCGGNVTMTIASARRAEGMSPRRSRQHAVRKECHHNDHVSTSCGRQFMPRSGQYTISSYLNLDGRYPCPCQSLLPLKDICY